MGFGNPYDDPYDEQIVAQFAGILHSMEVKIISLADTIGASRPELITSLFKHLIPEYPQVEFGAHLHSRKETVEEKIDAAYLAGCRRFDGAIMGYGGCPMAEDKLVGNIPTEALVNYLNKNRIKLSIQQEEFNKAVRLASTVFPA